MALQGSGTISFGNISAEFGLPPGKNIGAYRVSESYGEMSNMPLDIGVPQSGQIRFSDFYNKQLNVVVNCYTGGTQAHLYARTKWNNNSVNVVGGFRGKPASSAGTRAIVHLNKTIKGNGIDGSGFVCSFKTGPWESGTNLDVHIGTQGRIIGQGGRGGDGGERNRGNKRGQRAASGFGVQYPIDLWNYGIIGGGGGGGAGGKGMRKDRNKRGRNYRRCGWWCDSRSRNRRRDRRRRGGGGGGGGAGFPAGGGGSGGKGGGQRGADGTMFNGGAGGSGGGDGGRSGVAGGNLGQNGVGPNDGAGGGTAGRAIVISGGSITYKVSGDIRGATYNGAPYV